MRDGWRFPRTARSDFFLSIMAEVSEMESIETWKKLGKLKKIIVIEGESYLSYGKIYWTHGNVTWIIVRCIPVVKMLFESEENLLEL